MDVCLGDMGDTEPVLTGYLEVGVYIALGIDHYGFACLLAADYIAGLGQRFIKNVLKEHGVLEVYF
ncbi:hypothetical protein GCM10007390_17870 [Persicitalea jodogahamensis]|uniref:Uncharacterized protein n=1 Tax=Persicitalea jodogahamensis TaxID=402147 RepID=A0A8J3G981_9BACT|nr:hypothetical protein GCM10007390_17870 [Persicitalea jodogahamensis]